MELHQLSITELQERYRSGANSPREAVESILRAMSAGDDTIGSCG
jgi:hypothetical protein